MIHKLHGEMIGGIKLVRYQLCSARRNSQSISEKELRSNTSFDWDDVDCELCLSVKDEHKAWKRPPSLQKFLDSKIMVTEQN
jgi:hypothetical protein